MNCSASSVSFSSSTLDSEGKSNRDRKASESNIRVDLGQIAVLTVSITPHSHAACCSTIGSNLGRLPFNLPLG
jgi:hypothetical protein